MLKRSLAIMAAVSMLTLAACSDDGGDDAAGTDAAGSSQAPDDVTCDYPTDGQEPARPVDAPPSEPTVSGKVEVTFKTNVGDLNATLDAEDAPCTVNSFVSLAEQDFYDDTPCPRVVSGTDFGILQCGDPTGTTSGGPGYSFADELSGSETYPAGTLAMANGGADTNGSQFFFVFTESNLDPLYTTFGTFDQASIKILKQVGAKGNDGSNPAGGGKPNQPVTFKDVIVE